MTTADLVKESRGEELRIPTPENGHAPLFNPGETTGLRTQWQQIQGSFVDEPQTAVRQADELVACTMKRLAEVFADERARLESEWSRGQDVSTEDLRQVLRRYRSFFDRLLTV